MKTGVGMMQFQQPIPKINPNSVLFGCEIRVNYSYLDTVATIYSTLATPLEFIISISGSWSTSHLTTYFKKCLHKHRIELSQRVYRSLIFRYLQRLFIGNPRGNRECGPAQPSLFVLSLIINFSFLLSSLALYVVRYLYYFIMGGYV